MRAACPVCHVEVALVEMGGAAQMLDLTTPPGPVVGIHATAYQRVGQVLEPTPRYQRDFERRRDRWQRGLGSAELLQAGTLPLRHGDRSAAHPQLMMLNLPETIVCVGCGNSFDVTGDNA